MKTIIPDESKGSVHLRGIVLGTSSAPPLMKPVTQISPSNLMMHSSTPVTSNTPTPPPIAVPLKTITPIQTSQQPSLTAQPAPSPVRVSKRGQVVWHGNLSVDTVKITLLMYTNKK